MKKVITLLCSLALLCGMFVFSANAAEQQYYEVFKQQYFDGKDPLLQDLEAPYYYRELYTHQTNGDPDWVLINSDAGNHCEVVTSDVFFGRYFYQCDMAYPFVYTYGIYDIAQERFFDLGEIKDESRYPDLQEVFDSFHVGKRIGYEPLFKDEFYQYASWKPEPPYDDVKYYRELAYHCDGNGDLDWAFVQGDTNISQETLCYEVLGDRVFRDSCYHVPFDLTYGVYLVNEQRFRDITFIKTKYEYERKYSELYPDLLEDLEKFNLGEKIGDINRDGRLDIGDATGHQRCIAEYVAYPDNDAVSADGYQTRHSQPQAYLTDVNRDGKRDINDVTAVQRILCE